MPRKKNPIPLVEVALEGFRGRLITSRYDTWVKIREGHMDGTPAEYVKWKKGTPAIFVCIHRGKKTAAGRTTGWAEVMVNGVLGYLAPAKIRHMLLLDDVVTDPQ
jgi:hypothetical protein